MQDLLHWAIEHSDPEVLKQQAYGAAAGAPTPERLSDLQELMEAMRQEPSEAELIQLAANVLSNDTSDDQQRLDSLEALAYLVEPIDNANDLKVLGAVGPIIRQLESGTPQVQASAAHVLGVAASNNMRFQADALEAQPRLMHILLQIALKGHAEATPRSLYAAGAFARSGQEGAALFLSANGLQALTELLKDPLQRASVQRKALDLIADLAGLEINLQGAESAGLHAAVLSSAVQSGWDIKERAMLTLAALLKADAHSVHLLNALGAATKLQENWSELQDVGYREELQQLHASVIHMLASSRANAFPDEL
ncbi:hypothetical protein WJX74_001124 [Apatococcus lobatus]|uniref:Nucleotide exchange factor Fes1 domain-containing protein n=1 Tax=Apatococcus lobatus TaxID=904363 RepID=A0AAW1S025_9CHLO